MSTRVMFIDSVSRWGGGAQASMLALASALRDRGYECSLLTTAETTLTERARQLGINIELLPMRYFQRWSPLTYYAAGPVRLRRLLRARKISLVHTNCDESVAPATRAAAGLGIPVVCHIRDWDRGWFRPHVLRGLERASAVVAISEAMRDVSVSRGLSGHNLHVVYNGIDSSPYAEASAKRSAMRAALGLSGDEVALAVVGRVTPRKGQMELLEVAAHPTLRGLPVRFFIIGDDWTSTHEYDREVQARAARLGVTDRVHFLGEREDVPALLAACDLSGAPFLREAFGRVVVEAFAAGLPVVGWATGAIPELVRDGIDGLLVPPGDIAGLAGAIAELAADASRRRAMSVSARLRAADFGMDRLVAGVTAVYERVLERAASPGRGVPARSGS